jgi:hypothetical protein
MAPKIKRWTCARCEVTVGLPVNPDTPKLPVGWVKKGQKLYCLACRREMAEEDSVADVPEGAPAAKTQALRSAARVEFEIKRDPDRPDNQIAQACRTSIPAVKKARERLGMPGPAPGANKTDD